MREDQQSVNAIAAICFLVGSTLASLAIIGGALGLMLGIAWRVARWYAAP